MTDYKLIAVDVDGTLLTSRGVISPRTRAALRHAIAGGAQLVVATGRRRTSARPILEPLKLPYILVSSQGAAVWQDGALVAHSHLPAPAARIALEIIRQHGLATAILGNSLQEEVIWVDGNWHSDPRLAAYLKRNQHVVRPFHPAAFDHDPIEFIVMGSMERLERLDEALTGHHVAPAVDPPAEAGPTEEHPLWRVIFSRNQFTAGGAIEVVGPTTSKAAALAVLCERLGLTPSQVVAFGDNVNDVEMLEFAGLGVAMGNATDDARAVADRIAPSNDEDGIAVVLEELFPSSP
ncbi:MAG TPA: Cof-type HAD-IIB family hydrolase [Chloroflexota bacterium]|nr:Cof-type HAD-IIB family hydrolase [Chloroflexota bacterium]